MNVVDDVLRKVQLTQLEILLEVDRICKKHNLTYLLWAGTMLGAIRHKGFIPWDDDIDIAMKRDDYEKFLEICKTELSSHYFLQHHKTEPYYILQLAKIRKNKTQYVEESRRILNIHHGIWIDIFPLDNVFPGSMKENIRCFIVSLLLRFNTTRNLGVSLNSSYIKRILGNLLAKLSFLLINKKRYDMLVKYLITLFNSKNSEYLNELCLHASKNYIKRNLISVNDYYDIIHTNFEGHLFPIPRNYDLFLTNNYGEYNKLPPENERIPKHTSIGEIVV